MHLHKHLSYYFIEPTAFKVNITKNIESSSVFIQWTDDAFDPDYILTWTSKRDGLRIASLDSFQTSYTITGLTLDTVYTITLSDNAWCGDTPEFITSILFSADTTASISPTVTTGPMTIISSVNPSSSTASSSTTFTTASCIGYTTSTIFNVIVTTSTVTTTLCTNNPTITTTVITTTTTTAITTIATTMTTTTTTFMLNTCTTTTATTAAITATAATTAAVSAVTPTTAGVVVSPISTANPAETIAPDKGSKFSLLYSKHYNEVLSNHLNNQ